MIKIENGRCEIKGELTDIFIDLVVLTIVLAENENLQEILAEAEKEVEKLIKEGVYVPHNTSNKS